MSFVIRASAFLTLLSIPLLAPGAAAPAAVARVRTSLPLSRFNLEIRRTYRDVSTVAGETQATAGYRGTVKTIATSLVNPVGSAYDADDGDLYVLTSFDPLIVSSNTAILRVGPSGEVRPFVTLPAGLASAIAYDRVTRTFYVSTFASAASSLPAILAVSTTGAVSVLAGGAGSGFADGTGAAATFDNPSGIAVDQADGNLYVYDFDRIRRVSTSGVVTTLTKPNVFPYVAQAYLGLVYDPVDRNLYLASTGNLQIDRISPASGSVVSFAGRCIAHFAPGQYTCDPLQRDGLGSRALFDGPSAFAADPIDGALYAVDTGNNSVRRIDLGANVTTLAGNGIAANRDGVGLNAQFDRPVAISYDSRGNRLDVTDYEMFPPTGPAAAIRAVTTSGAAPPPPSTPITLFETPSLDALPLAIDWRPTKPRANALIFSEQVGRFGEITAGGASYEQGDPVKSSALPGGPYDTVYGSDGSAWYLDASDRQLDHRSKTGAVTVVPLTSISSTPSVDQLTLGPDGNVWFVLATGSSTLVGSVTPDNKVMKHAFAAFSGGMTSLAFAADGNLWISNGTDLIELDRFAHVLLSDAYPANYLTHGPDGNVWFTQSDAIGTVRPNNAIALYPIRAAISGCEYYCSRAITAITAGSDGALWFAEAGQGQIGRLTLGGKFSEIPIPAARSVPSDITTGPDGNIWFVDAGAQKIGRLEIR